jgi:glycerol-3-phosphate dehydrogenase
MQGEPYDLAIVGGGINGAGIAADAAGRGLRVILFEAGDLGGGTSSASSKLIHGGLRYLEHGELRLVRESLIEREVLLGRAPHLIRPLRFVIPHGSGMRSRFLMRIGLFLYDHLATRLRISASEAVDLSRDPAGRPLKETFRSGFSYYDCRVDDARLVVTLALDAQERGAEIHTRTPVTALTALDDRWEITADSRSGPLSVASRVLINAAGPWCAEVARLAGSADRTPALRLVRGTHIVVPRIAGAENAYLLQNPDGRVVFALPFEQDFTLIGTTEVGVETPSDGFTPSREEEDYLIAAAGRYFAKAPAHDDIVWRFAGVRPLIEDGAKQASAVSRDYRLDLVQRNGAPPLLNVIGGKITTFRRLAEAVLQRLGPFFPDMKPPWTAQAPLPGGDLGGREFEAFCQDLVRRHPGIAPATLLRLASLYGSRAERIVDDAETDHDFGDVIGGGLTEREVLYLGDTEWARTAEDVLWRRTKAGLHLDAGQRQAAEILVQHLVGGRKEIL